MKSFFKTFTPMLVLTMLFSSNIGCSYDDNPISHENSKDVDESLLSLSTPTSLLNTTTNTLLSVVKGIFYIEKLIFTEIGGILNIDNENGISSLIIGENALPYDMTVGFKWSETDRYKSEIYNADSPQDNFSFSKPVKVILAYNYAQFSGVDESRLALYKYDHTGNSWDLVNSTIHQDDNQIEAFITKSGTYRVFQQIEGGLLEFHEQDLLALSKSKYIRARRGGTIELGTLTSGVSKIEFGPRDLPRSMVISFEWVVGAINGTFAPHGTIFNDPVKVEFSYKIAEINGFDESKLFVTYFNENSGNWENIGGNVDPDKKIVTVYLEHFSRYAVAYGR